MIIDAVRLTTANQVLLAIGVVVLCVAIVICICLIIGEIATKRGYSERTHNPSIITVYSRLQVITGSTSGGRCSGSGVCSAVVGSAIPSWTTTE